MNKVRQFLITAVFISLGLAIGVSISPLILIVLPTIVFGKKIGLYFLSLLPFCSLFGAILGAISGVIISYIIIKKQGGNKK